MTMVPQTPNTETMDHVGFVVSSTYRETVTQALLDGAKTPSQIHEEFTDGEKMPHISRALTELRERELVELLVPEDRQKGRIYGLTDTGQQVAEFVVEM